MQLTSIGGFDSIFIILPGFVMSIWAGKQYWRKWESERRRIAAQFECLLELQSHLSDWSSEEDYSNALIDRWHKLETIKKKHFGNLNLITDKGLVKNIDLRLDPLFKLEFLDDWWIEVYFRYLDDEYNQVHYLPSDDKMVNTVTSNEVNQESLFNHEARQHSVSMMKAVETILRINPLLHQRKDDFHLVLTLSFS